MIRCEGKVEAEPVHWGPLSLRAPHPASTEILMHSPPSLPLVQVEAEIRARLEVNERVQRQRAVVEDQIAAKLDAEMQAFLGLQKQIMLQGQQMQQQQGGGQMQGEGGFLVPSLPSDVSTSSYAAASAAPPAASVSGTALNLPLGIRVGSEINGNGSSSDSGSSLTVVQSAAMVPSSSGANDGGGGLQLSVSSLDGMRVQLSQASMQPTAAADGSVSLNLQITFVPHGTAEGRGGAAA